MKTLKRVSLIVFVSLLGVLLWKTSGTREQVVAPSHSEVVASLEPLVSESHADDCAHCATNEPTDGEYSATAAETAQVEPTVQIARSIEPNELLKSIGAALQGGEHEIPLDTFQPLYKAKTGESVRVEIAGIEIDGVLDARVLKDSILNAASS